MVNRILDGAAPPVQPPGREDGNREITEDDVADRVEELKRLCLVPFSVEVTNGGVSGQRELTLVEGMCVAKIREHGSLQAFFEASPEQARPELTGIFLRKIAVFLESLGDSGNVPLIREILASKLREYQDETIDLVSLLEELSEALGIDSKELALRLFSDPTSLIGLSEEAEVLAVRIDGALNRVARNGQIDPRIIFVGNPIDLRLLSFLLPKYPEKTVLNVGAVVERLPKSLHQLTGVSLTKGHLYPRDSELRFPQNFDAPCLEELKTSKVPLVDLPSSRLPALKTLSLSEAKVTEVPAGFDTPCLSTMTITNTPLARISRVGFAALKELHLEGLPLAHLPKGFSAPSLEKVTIIRTPLKALPSGEMPALKTLTLKNTHVAVIPDDLETPSLSELHVEESPLKALPGKRYDNLKAVFLQGTKVLEIGAPFEASNLVQLAVLLSPLERISDLSLLQLREFGLIKTQVREVPDSVLLPDELRFTARLNVRSELSTRQEINEALADR